MNQDTTDLKTAFLPAERTPIEQLHAQARAFTEHPYLDEIVSAVPDMVMVLNAQRQIVYANRALLDFAGYDTVDDIIGLRVGELLGCLHAFEREAGCGTTPFCQYCGAAQAVMASLHGQHAVQECHLNIAAERSPHSIDLRVWTRPLTFNDARFTLFTLADISDEVRRRELERVFFHDLLNSAGIVQATSALLQDVCHSETEDIQSVIEQGTTMTGLIQRAADRLIGEIQAQKAYTQLERDELEVEIETLRTRAILDDLVTGYRTHEIAEGRTLNLAPDTEDLEITSDRGLLARVLSNMIKNALEAVEPGETVTVGCRRSGANVEFWVHNPTVMPDHVKRQIFKRAFSTKGLDRGLGTYSMRLISERYLQGSVSFTAEADAGTTFRARYPLVLETESES